MDYERVKQHIALLDEKNRDTILEPTYQVIIIGYEGCPYSRKALQATHSCKECKEAYLFIIVDFEQGWEFKQSIEYQGTFPIVFVKEEDGAMKHIGGGTEMEEYSRKRHHGKKKTASSYGQRKKSKSKEKEALKKKK